MPMVRKNLRARQQQVGGRARQATRMQNERNEDHMKEMHADGALAAAEEDDGWADDEDHESADQELEFRERHLMPLSYDWHGTIVYAIFLCFFLYQTTADRSHGYYFTQYARDTADVDAFMKIDDAIKYQDWLEYRFFPGMHWNTINRSVGGTASIFVVGPPRIRAVRAVGAYTGPQETLEGDPDHPVAHQQNCGHAREMAGMKTVCFDLSSEEHVNGSAKWFDDVVRIRGSNEWMAQGEPPAVSAATGWVGLEYKTGGACPKQSPPQRDFQGYILRALVRCSGNRRKGAYPHPRSSSTVISAR